MLRLGIPGIACRGASSEINLILSLGVELKLGKALGRDFSLKDLRINGYDAVFLAIGAHRSRPLDVPGIDADGVLNAIDFLLNVNLGYKVELGERIVVIGGGNVAIDAARTAARQEKASAATSDITAALDGSLRPVRLGEAGRHGRSRGTGEMPADRVEIATGAGGARPDPQSTRPESDPDTGRPRDGPRDHRRVLGVRRTGTIPSDVRPRF
jgi:hypothetical protein